MDNPIEMLLDTISVTDLTRRCGQPRTLLTRRFQPFHGRQL